MKPSCLFLTVLRLALAGIVFISGPSQAQQQTQSGARNEGQNPPASAADQKPGKSADEAAGNATPPTAAPKPPASAGEQAPHPIQGQGTVKGSHVNPAPDGKVPAGRAGSGGHKTNNFGR